MKQPPQFTSADRVWHRKPAVRIAGAAAVLLLGAVVSARALNGRPKPQAPAVATATPPPAAVPAPKPAPTPPPAAEPAPAAANATDANAAPATGSAKVDASGAAGAAGATAAVAEHEAAPPADDAEGEAPAQDEPRHATKEKAPQLPVVIKSDPEGSRVATGRHVFGTTPLTLKLRPGNSYELTFTRAGYTTITRHYKFDGHGPQVLRVSLKKVPEVHKAPTPAPAPPPPPPKKKGFFER
jgi:hypothetical protein